MTIDPALRGTTFGKALEDAERAEQLKREQRAAEGPGLQPQARLLAQALRGQPAANTKAPPPAATQPSVAVNTPDHHAKHAAWVRMAQDEAVPFLSPDNIVQEASAMTAETHDTAAPALTLSATQIDILKSGFDGQPFKLGAVGRAIGKMMDLGLMIPGPKKGTWLLTETGKETYNTHLAQVAAANDQVFKSQGDGINLDDPALLDDRRESTRWQQIAEERQQKIKDLHKTLDDLGKVADDQRAQLKAFEDAPQPLSDIDRTEYEMLRTTVFAIEAMMRDDEENLTLVEYVTQLRESIANETAIVDDINALAAADGKGHMGPREYAQWLRALRAEAKSSDEEELVRLISGMRHEDSSNHSLVDYVADLRKKAGLVDDYAGRIESLNRCIEELRENLNARQITPARAADIMLAGQILDELCDMVPEIEGYRTAREQAVKAINSLKAKRA